MDPLDEALCRAHEIFLGDFSEEPDPGLNALLPSLIDAGYVVEEPWGDDPDWFLWRFTKAGVARGEELGRL